MSPDEEGEDRGGEDCRAGKTRWVRIGACLGKEPSTRTKPRAGTREEKTLVIWMLRPRIPFRSLGCVWSLTQSVLSSGGRSPQSRVRSSRLKSDEWRQYHL